MNGLPSTKFDKPKDWTFRAARVCVRAPLTLLVMFLAEGASAQDSGRGFSVAELRNVGREALARRVEMYGRDDDHQRWRDVAHVIGAVQAAVVYTAHELRWEIVGDSSINAAALPGGAMVINVGLPLFCVEYAAAHEHGDRAPERRRYYGCLAAVIAHEFAHLNLGHTDSLASILNRRQEIQRREGRARTVTARTRDSVLMAALEYERHLELEADHAGALYMLRAGWDVEDVIDVLLSMDALERSQPNWRTRLTWTSTHPRPSERIALLEAYRTRLNLRQRDFDDALALIEYGEMPDSALVMLDRVLSDLPSLQAADHARAVVLAQQWLMSAPVGELRVRPSMPAYDTQFMASVGGVRDSAAFATARRTFSEVLHMGIHPYTLSNLAVLDAYAGDFAAARRRAALAAELMPEDPGVQNNLGVVLFLTGSLNDARYAFERAEQASGRQVAPAIAFNVARATAASGDTALALRLLGRYLARDRRSPWAIEARDLQRQLSHRRGMTSSSSSRSSDGASPLIAGVRLGASRSQVIAALGRPEPEEDDVNGDVWRYPARGVTLILDPGVRLVTLEQRDAGEIQGVRVGDEAADALSRAGTDSTRTPMEKGIAYRYDRGSWTLILLIRDERVIAVTAHTALR